MAAAYLACSTQWFTGGLGTRTGLRYADCIAVLQQHLPRWQARDPRTWGSLNVPELIEGLQVIEGAVLGADAERAQAAADKRSHGVRP